MWPWSELGVELFDLLGLGVCLRDPVDHRGVREHGVAVAGAIGVEGPDLTAFVVGMECEGEDKGLMILGTPPDGLSMPAAMAQVQDTAARLPMVARLFTRNSMCSTPVVNIENIPRIASAPTTGASRRTVGRGSSSA